MFRRFLVVGSLALAAACGRATESTDPPGCNANPDKANLAFTLNGLDGRGVRLAEFQGKVVFLNFWATWCVPCQLEIPILVELQNRYRQQGLEVVGVVAQDEFIKAGPYADKARMNYTILDATNRPDFEEAWGPPAGLPSSFLIARDGSVCFEHLGVPRPQGDESLEDAIRRTFDAEIRALL